jgi:hypothetical protein
VHGPADAVASVVLKQAVPVFACCGSNGMAYVAELAPWLGRLYSSLERGVGRSE